MEGHASRARKERALGALALGGVLALKLFIGLSTGAHPLLVPEGELDGAYYRHFAERVAGGDFWLLEPGSFFGQPAAPFFISPLYIYSLAIFLKIGGSLAAVRAIQLVLGTAAVWLLALTARRWFDRRAMWITGALSAACGLFTFYESLILQAALDPFLTALDLYALTRALQDGRRRDWVAAGAALGLHALNRPNLLIVVAGLTMVVAIAKVRPSAGSGRPELLEGRSSKVEVRKLAAPGLFLAAAALVIAPATLRNYRVAGEFIPISSHGGLNFYIGNGPEADGTFVRAMGIEPSIRGQWLEAPKVASAAAGRTLGPSETSAFFRDRALTWVRSYPEDAARLLVRKAWLASSSVFVTLNHSYPFFAHDTSSGLGLLAAGPALIVPLGVLGLVFARPRREGFLIWAAFVPLAFLSVVLFFVAARYRLPYLVALTVAAGGGASWVIERIRAGAWRSLVPAAIAAAVTLAVVIWPTGLDDGRAEERVRMGLYEIEQGRVTEGESWIARAVATHGFPGVAHFRAGRLHESKGRPGDALTHYQQAIALDPDQPELRVAAARVLNDMARPDQAVAELDRTAGSLDLPNSASAASLDSVAREYERAGLALVLAGRPADAVDVFAKAIARRPRVASFHLNRAVALAMVGRATEAKGEAQSALALDPSYEKAQELLRRLK